VLVLVLVLLLLLYGLHNYWAVAAAAGSLHCYLEVLIACQLLQPAGRAAASAAAVAAAVLAAWSAARA
jgi:hypothetical protein